MESEEYYLREKWLNLYKKGEITIEMDRVLISCVLSFPKIVTGSVIPADEEQWAWNEITANLNQVRFKNGLMNILANDSKARFNLLRPLVITQSGVLDCSPLTHDMIHAIRNFNNIRSMHETNHLTATQKLLKENAHWIVQLPMDFRKNFESEAVDSLLDAEIQEAGEIKYMPNGELKKLQETFEKDAERFAIPEPKPAPDVVNSPVKNIRARLRKSTRKSTTTDLPAAKKPRYETAVVTRAKTATATATTTKPKNLPKIITAKVKMAAPKTQAAAKPTTSKNSATKKYATKATEPVAYKPVLKLIPPKRIPISEAHLYTRPCVVRLRAIELGPPRKSMRLLRNRK